MAHLAETGIPRLLVVDAGTEPPVGADCCQDWMWRDGGEDELRLRVHQLSLRALEHGHHRPYLDRLGLVHVGLRSIPLPPKEQALIGVLLERFNEAVPRDDPSGRRGRTASPQNTLAQRISKLRSRLSWVGLEIAVLPGTRYVLRARRAVPGQSSWPATDGFEDR